MPIHSHSHSSSFPLSFTLKGPGRGRPVKTAKDYRAMAEECVKWAREAHDDDVRAPLLQLAQTWLDAASKLDGLPASQIAPTPKRPNDLT
jgi:hypothetical protein